MEELGQRIVADLLDEVADALSRAADRIREARSDRAASEPGPKPEPAPDWLTTSGLAEWLQRKEQTIRKWRHVGGDLHTSGWGRDSPPPSSTGVRMSRTGWQRGPSDIRRRRP